MLPVVTYRTPEEALQYVRSRPSHWPSMPSAPGPRPGRHRRDHRGGACVNNTLLHLANPDLPFGGVGPSGLGNYHGRSGFRTFSHARAVMRRAATPCRAGWRHPTGDG